MRTLVYHDLFDYPLTFGELYRLLIAEKKTKERDVQKTLVMMEADPSINSGQVQRIEADGFFYFLRGRKRIVSLRKRREKYSREKLAIAKRVMKWLGLIPTIRMIGVTGAVAVGNAKKNDDIDFLMITASGRVWLTRILAVLLIEVLGKRRRPADKEVRDKICLNVFLDEEHLKMPKGKRNLFVAHEIGQMRVLYQKNNVYQKFLRENRWMRNFLPNGIEIKKLEIEKLREKKEKKCPNILISQFLNILGFFEKVAYWGQLRYMESKKTTEQVSLHFAFFHPKDVGERVMREYRKKISNF